MSPNRDSYGFPVTSASPLDAAERDRPAAAAEHRTGLALLSALAVVAALSPSLAATRASAIQEAAPRPPADRPDPTHFVFLETGPGDPSASAEDRAAMQQVHLGNLTRLYVEGKSPLAGPLGRESRKIRGIVVLALPDAHDVASEFADDPFVAGDFLRVHSHRWTCRVGSFAVPEGAFALGEYVLGIVRRGPQAATPTAAVEAYASLERSLAGPSPTDDADTAPPGSSTAGDAPETPDSGTPDSGTLDSSTPDSGAAGPRPGPLGVAGPVEIAKDAGDDAIVGLMIFRESDLDAVRRLVDDADTSPGGTLDITLFRQYLGKGIIDAPK